MFFADSTRAFANLRRMLKRGGRVGFVCWRSIGDNELDSLPVKAADLSMPIGWRPFTQPTNWQLS